MDFCHLCDFYACKMRHAVKSVEEPYTLRPQHSATGGTYMCCSILMNPQVDLPAPVCKLVSNILTCVVHSSSR